MAELLDSLRDLRAIPKNVHWFCPRSEDDQGDTYDDEDLIIKYENDESSNNRRKRVEEAQTRTQLAFHCLQILLSDADEAVEYQNEVKNGLDQQFSRCDLCIRWYYSRQKEYLEKMRQDYNEEEVANFSKAWETTDITRIKKGLLRANTSLKAMPPQQRNLTLLVQDEMFAIFECLSCEAFLRDSNLLEEFFDETFELAQSTKRLKVRQYLPAMTWFLFDSKPVRTSWALQSWSAKYRMALTKRDFDWTVRDPLYKAMVEISTSTDPIFFQRFWCGVKLIVEKLDRELVTHSLRALDIDICRMTLEHLHVDNPGFRFLLHTVEDLFRKSPDDFWDAMGAISPATVVEQIFNNPQCLRFVAETDKTEFYDLSSLKDMLSWIEPFMRSLKTANQPTACRSLVFQLLDRFQSDTFPEFSRRKCYRQGLATLALTLQNFVGESATGSVERVVVADTLEVVSSHIKTIIDITQRDRTSDSYRELSGLCMDVVRNSLCLDCKSLKADHESLEAGKSVQHDVGAFSPAIWEAVTDSLHPGNIILAQNVLRGLGDIVGLERIRAKLDQKQPEQNRFNTSYGRISQIFCDILERLADFDPNDLDQLFKQNETANTLYAALFAPDDDTYKAAIDVIKAISAQSGRQEALAHLLQSFFDISLYSLSWAIRRIAHKRTFASTPRMLKTCEDVIDVLCNSQDGILRTRTLRQGSEVKAIKSFWTFLWQALSVIFQMTETWSLTRNVEKMDMVDLCRDTMQLSEKLFDQYSIFAAAIDASINSVKQEPGLAGSESEDARKQLLQNPNIAMDSIVKWLRLRDAFLVATSVSLVSKILRRLGTSGMSIAKAPLQYIERVIGVEQSMRTILTPQHKAELIRALEQHQGHPVAAIMSSTFARTQPKKQSTITSWTKTPDRDSDAVLSGMTKPEGSQAGKIDFDSWRSKSKTQQGTVKTEGDEFGDSGILDKDILELSYSVEKFKQQNGLQRHNALARSKHTVPKAAVGEGRAFREKREKEREAKRQRDLQELARLKGSLLSKGLGEQTTQEGSGLQGIGVRGKDHAPSGSSMMVSSDSESESDEELDRTLFGIDKPVKSSKALKEYRESKMRAMKEAKPQGPVKKTRQVRSAKDMRARLAPDLSSLHRTILSWDFFHDGQFPPASDRDDYSLVTNTFRTPMDYQNTFAPLLILEAWQGFLKAKEEGTLKPFEIKIASRSTVDSFLEISVTMTVADGKDSAIGEADIFILSRSSNPISDSSQPHLLARVHKVSRRKNATEIIFRSVPSTLGAAALSPGSTLNVVKILSITPLEREYGALQGLQYYDLCEEVLKAKPSPLLLYSDKQLEPIIANYNVNNAQAKAVRSAIDNDAFTLIQGPPGSGKTKTIVAIVGALLTNSLADNGMAISRPQFPGQRTPAPARAPPSKKLLVCAPSNAAVDELVMRFKQGVKTLTGETQKLSIVRLGRSDVINANVLDVTLDELVNVKLNLVVGDKKNPGEEIQKLLAEHKKTSEELDRARSQLNEMRSKGETVAQQQHVFELLKRKKTQIGLKLDSARDNTNTAARDAEINRRVVQQEILDSANVICATLSGSGHEMFQNLSIEFETVIIDEAAQSIELSALIPLKYGCSKCILVGDPKQLPPTVLSREAARFQYEQSLFVRMQANHPNDVHLLDTQYRMHPQISLFPSKVFYDGRLVDGPGMAELRRKPWHASTILGTYRFFDVQGQHQNVPKGHSLINLAEIDIALKLFQRLSLDYAGYDLKGKVGIITPYKSQLRELKSKFASKFGDSIFETIEFNTTDAFQGRESEIIIFSCVRASSSKGIGFLADIRRMNVGLTRAKSSLWVLGNSQSLMHGEFWAGLITDARSRGVFTDGDLSTLLRKPTERQDVDLHIPSPVEANSLHDNDIDMPDVQVERRRSSDIPRTEARSSISMDMANTKHPMPRDVSRSRSNSINTPRPGMSKVHTAGGQSGLDARKTCTICGSYSHLTRNCDNDAAKLAAGRVCRRCGDVDHFADQCDQQRCLECGEFGHLSRTCTNTRQLTESERTKVHQEEIQHKNRVQRLAEKQKKFQLGGHDPQVPLIQVSGEKPMKGANQIGPRPSPNHSSHFPQASTNFGRKRPDKKPHMKPAEAAHNGVAEQPGRVGKSPELQHSNRRTSPEENRAPNRQSGPPRAPRPGMGPNGAPRGPPPPKKKREADPFIRPKTKRPRP